jgi:hypothetical protein
LLRKHGGARANEEKRLALRRTRMALRLAPVEDEMIEHLDDVEGGRPTYLYFLSKP